MPDRTQLHEIDNEHMDIGRKGISDMSGAVTVVVAGDSLAPGAPSSLTATSVPKGIKLEWTTNASNEDGTNCVDQRWCRILWKSTTGVSKTSYDGNVVISGRAGDNKAWTDTNIASGTTRYYVVTSIDSNGNESSESNEAHADGGNVDITTSIPDNASSYVFDDSYGAGGEGIALGDGLIGIIFKQHDSGWTNFSHYRLWFMANTGSGFGSTWEEIKPINQIAFIHKGLNTTYHYKYKATIVANDGTESTTPDYATNNSNAGDGGAGYLPNATDNTLVMASTVLAENLIAADEVRGEHFYAQSYLAINDSTFGNDGIQLEYNSGDPRAYIGNGATDSTGRFIKFDGTDLSWQGKNSSLTAGGVFTATDAVITGSLTAGAGSSISGAYITSLSFDKITAATNTASLTIGSSGSINAGQTSYDSGTGFWLGNVSGTPKFSIGNSSGNKLTWDGSTLAITGTMTIGSGSTYAGNTIGTTYTAAKCTDPNADQTSANTAADTAKVQGYTIISGGYIATSYLTASNIQTGTLDASKITVNNLSASSITTDTMDFARISQSSVDIIESMIHTGAVTSGKISVSTLSAISANIGSITAGTVTGVTFRTASSGARAQIDTTGTYAHTVAVYDSSRQRVRVAVGYFNGYDSSGNLTVGLNTDGSTTSYIKSPISISTSATYGGSSVVIASPATFHFSSGKYFTVTGTSTSGGQWGLGYINITIDGVSRSIAIENAH